MVIKCTKNDGHDHFILPELNSIEELKQKYASDKPIEAYVGIGTYQYNYGQMILERFKECKLYLDNYLYYRDVSNYVDVKEYKEWDDMNNNICSKCQNKEWGICTAGYIKDEKMACSNFEEIKPTLSFLDRLKIRRANRL